jgi:hypothetical protein
VGAGEVDHPRRVGELHVEACGDAFDRGVQRFDRRVPAPFRFQHRRVGVVLRDEDDLHFRRGRPQLGQDDPDVGDDVADLGFDFSFAAAEGHRESAGVAEELQDVVGADVERDRAGARFFGDRQRVAEPGAGVGVVQKRLREGAPGRPAGAVCRPDAGAFDEGVGRLPRTTVVDDFQFRVDQSQRRAEVVDVAVVEVRRVDSGSS